MSPAVRTIRKRLLAKPGFTRLPVCPHCLKEIPLLEYAAHTRECEKASLQPPPAAQALVNAANGARPGLVYGLFSATSIARLEKAGAEIAELRRQLRDEHSTTSPSVRVQRNREIARRECQLMAVVVYQLRQRFTNQGSGMVFLRGLKPSVVAEGLGSALTELNRMSHPAAWRIA